MVHFNFGNYSRPVGRQSFGYNNVNINSYEKNVYGGFPMQGGMYGMDMGMFPTQYGMPQMGGFGMNGCCHGHNNNWGVGETLMALGSLATGFFGTFNGGETAVETKDNKTNTQQTEAFQEAIRTLQEEHKKANEARNQEIAALKAQVQELLKQQETTEVKPETEVNEVEDTEETSETTETPETTEADATEAARKQEEARKAEQERKEIEALKKEGITKNSNGEYTTTVKGANGEEIQVTGKTADEVRQAKKAKEAEVNKIIDYCAKNGIKRMEHGFAKTITTLTGATKTIEAETLEQLEADIKKFKSENRIGSPATLGKILNERLKEDSSIEGKVKEVQIVKNENGKQTLKIVFEDNGMLNTVRTFITVEDMDKDFDKILAHVKDRINDSFWNGGMNPYD